MNVVMERKESLFQRESVSGKSSCVGSTCPSADRREQVVTDSYVRLLSCHVTHEEIEETWEIEECISHTHLAAGEVMSSISPDAWLVNVFDF